MAYYDDISNVWELVRDSFHDRFSSETINLWFGKMQVYSFKGRELTMSVQSQYKRDIIMSEFLDDMKNRFANILGFDVDIIILVDDPYDEKNRLKPPAEAEEPKPGPGPLGSTMPPYNFEYTFDNFIVGNSNKFAHAAATAVAAAPAMNYNPLFIYGPSGLGKTHLLYAITNEVKKKKNDAEIIYIKGEDFTNQLIDALSRQKTAEFRNRYRSCDMLLIDDIQFIAGKVSTQEEFFHTFNALYEEHKQIILTSDRPPREIKTLEDRLKTRFEWGLLADIQPPDLELRIAIIKKKAEQVNVTIPDDVLNFLAENLRSNIRQIEGAIKKLGALAFISGKDISMDLARGCISELLGGEEPVSVTVDKIFAAVYRRYGISKEDILSQKRTKDIAQARHITVYLIKKITEMSFKSMGKSLGRDHTTIMSSCEVVEKRLRTDAALAVELNEIIKEVAGDGTKITV